MQNEHLTIDIRVDGTPVTEGLTIDEAVQALSADAAQDGQPDGPADNGIVELVGPCTTA